MAKYLVKETSFIGNCIRQPGDIVELGAGIKPGSALARVQDEPEKAETKSSKGGKGADGLT